MIDENAYQSVLSAYYNAYGYMPTAAAPAGSRAADVSISTAGQLTDSRAVSVYNTLSARARSGSSPLTESEIIQRAAQLAQQGVPTEQIIALGDAFGVDLRYALA
jgi:hypothetical protein